MTTIFLFLIGFRGSLLFQLLNAWLNIARQSFTVVYECCPVKIIRFRDKIISLNDKIIRFP